jgi:hypothetical protein
MTTHAGRKTTPFERIFDIKDAGVCVGFIQEDPAVGRNRVRMRLAAIHAAVETGSVCGDETDAVFQRTGAPDLARIEADRRPVCGNDHKVGTMKGMSSWQKAVVCIGTDKQPDLAPRRIE